MNWVTIHLYPKGFSALSHCQISSKRQCWLLLDQGGSQASPTLKICRIISKQQRQIAANQQNATNAIISTLGVEDLPQAEARPP